MNKSNTAWPSKTEKRRDISHANPSSRQGKDRGKRKLNLLWDANTQLLASGPRNEDCHAPFLPGVGMTLGPLRVALSVFV